MIYFAEIWDFIWDSKGSWTTEFILTLLLTTSTNQVEVLRYLNFERHKYFGTTNIVSNSYI